MQPRRPDQPKRRKRGFERTASLLSARIAKAGESRGFAVSRLLTHWEDVVGAETARAARPVKVQYGRQGFGATLTLLTTGAQAPMLEMQKESIRERVNACYGYSAISRIKLTQTAPIGFAEPATAFEGPKTTPTPEMARRAADMSQDVADDGLRNALETLGKNVLSRQPKR
ncbi:hypothetical protein ACMU_02790 [Actibacterium mucosum KCTC 23349]|uniref:Zn-ribbon-containing protein n=1 Tax=Actibacterium mucosum KCTC 23349 TaxID=1454373 RepID=A0A037ZPK1_9RHOB|nr:DciA family protein [Actibacterium mucosum]KAJ57448.1 hypothetical protein ACMU_02790 [Actibacterium mucosum KCTC 23349]